MKHINNAKCNCEDCIWNRIEENSGKLKLKTKTGKHVKYVVDCGIIKWVGQENSHKKLRDQSKKQILECVVFRSNGARTTKYPQGAQSYKWALLNHSEIWLD